MLIGTGFPGDSDGKEPACNVGDLGSIPGLGRSPGGGYGNPLQCSCLENPHAHKSLGGYSPWDHKESDRTEQQNTAAFWSILLRIQDFPGGASGEESTCFVIPYVFTVTM